MKIYITKYENKKALGNYISTIKARGGKYKVKGLEIKYWFDEGKGINTVVTVFYKNYEENIVLTKKNLKAVTLLLKGEK